MRLQPAGIRKNPPVEARALPTPGQQVQKGAGKIHYYLIY